MSIPTVTHALQSMLDTLRDYSENENCSNGIRLADIESLIKCLEYGITPAMLRAGLDAANGTLSESLVVEVFIDMLAAHNEGARQ